MRGDKEAMLKEETLLWDQGYRAISGIDEAGRGPLAGPVVAACVHIPKGLWIDGVYDSKKLSPNQREYLFDQLTHHPDIHYGVGIVSAQVIDEINILQATLKAMQEAFFSLQVLSDFVLIDGVSLKLSVPSLKLIKGDARSYLVAAASIIAKVTRDRMMADYHTKWPDYRFDQHKGYGTLKHCEALKSFGPCPIHRLTFEPIKSLLNPLLKI